MKPFLTIAIPHKDVTEGRLTMEIFAADLWQVYKGTAPDEYKDPTIFFRKTYMTDGLRNLLEMARRRLEGEGGDPIIQLQTPFGGGKTHSLIALFHKAREWGAKVVVIDGAALDPKGRTVWEEIEYQLTGEVKLLEGKTSPGKENLENLLRDHQPLLILMDEILTYATKAAGVTVGETTLASQLLSFMLELTSVVRSLGRAMLIITLPTSILEHYDESAEKLFQKLQKTLGRMEKVYTPVRDEEICHVIKRRLFSHINEEEAKEIVESFLEYAEREGILNGEEKAIYRERFQRCYPFQPEVIDTLYKRWGSIPTFQRTRGLLRLLSLVIYSLKGSKAPFIRLSDFNLGNEDIRRELIKHIGQEYDSIIAMDITSEDSGAKRVDRDLGDAYLPFSFGTRVSTSIFMYSFSGGPEKGATPREIKFSCAELSVPSSIIVEALSKLKERLFYLWEEGGRYYFKNEPNLNRILVNKMESITDDVLEDEERTIISKNLGKKSFEIYVWPETSKDVPDTRKLKLILMRYADSSKCRELLERYGGQPRVYRNTLIFLCPSESDRPKFVNSLREKIAWQLIERDRSLSLTSKQLKQVRDRIKTANSQVDEDIKSLYRIVMLPSKDGLKKLDLGVPTFGADTHIDARVFNRLKEEEEILEKISPLILREKYLKDRDYVETKNILESFYKTPGEIRIAKDEALIESIREGVEKGLFGLGYLEGDEVICKYFEERVTPDLVEGEVIIRAEICQEQRIEEEITEEIKEVITQPAEPEGGRGGEVVTISPPEPVEKYNEIRLVLDVPAGKLSDVVRMVNFLRRRFNEVGVTVEINAKVGEISVSEYEDKILEAINQAGISIKNEEVEKNAG